MTRHVTLVAERGLPYRIAERIAPEVEESLAKTSVGPVTVTVDDGALMLDDDGEVHLSDSVPTTSDDADLVVFFTELPRLWRGRPVPAEIDSRRSAAIISVPACGTVGLRRNTTDLTVACVAGLAAPDTADETFRSVESGQREWHVDEERDGKSTLAATSRWGWVRVVTGMVRVNRPWRLVSTLKGLIAAAAATASFGIFYTSIWQMATVLSPWRLGLITMFSIAVMGTWLIVANRLWEARRKRSSAAAWSRMYNAVTVVTVFAGIATMYIGLYILTFIAGLVVIDAGFMTQQIQKPASLTSFLLLAWLSTSMGVVAGALGSSSDSYESILRATFGQRERERRLQQDRTDTDDQVEKSRQAD
ncbi:hypothetical protein [Gordonia zhaorongruii]|uniref:hypothetical protein n=1 Tax=Gordonia zhaorongruii TaxID=2597659 RepID=UPI00104582E5|nr:hypothetical protein [Gordonia zhaorongruii]